MYKVKPVSEQNFDEILAAVWNSSIAFWRYLYLFWPTYSMYFYLCRVFQFWNLQSTNLTRIQKLLFTNCVNGVQNILFLLLFMLKLTVECLKEV